MVRIFLICAAIIVVCHGLSGCSIKNEQEYPLLRISGPYYLGDYRHYFCLTVAEDDREIDCFVPHKNLRVQFEGMRENTSVILKDVTRSNSDDRNAEEAVVIVPTISDEKRWQDFIDRQKEALAKKKIQPRQVLPPDGKMMSRCGSGDC